jgi:hypothetical protein
MRVSPRLLHTRVSTRTQDRLVIWPHHLREPLAFIPLLLPERPVMDRSSTAVVPTMPVRRDS